MKFIYVFSILLIHQIIIGQIGPGGVGNTSSNGVWLRADALPLSNGTSVSSWTDVSGNMNNANQLTVNRQPIYFASSTMNGQPIVRLDGVNDEFLINDHPILDGTSGITFYAAIRPTNLDANPRGILGKRIDFTTSTNYAYTWFFWNGNRINVDIDKSDNRFASAGTYANNTNYILGLDFNGSLPVAQRSRLFNNSLLDIVSSESSNSVPATTPNLCIGALNTNYGTYLGADVGEIIHFNYSLDSTEHIIVQNYLSAKYNITLGTNNLYDEDNVGNGNYDFDVAGIGRVDASQIHNDSRGSGIVRINNPSNLDNSEFLFWGHDNGVLQASEFFDIPSTVQARLVRIWRASEVNMSLNPIDVGSIDITWDLSNLMPVTAADLRLLVDTDNDGVFADETAQSGAIDLGGGQFLFPGVNLIANNLRFTLATINIPTTPLPIIWGKFELESLKNRKVAIHWSTMSEYNTENFLVQRSIDNLNWLTIGSVDAAHFSNSELTYTFIDENPSEGINYYKIIQIDKDGLSTVSQAKAISVIYNTKTKVDVFPNPSKGFLAIKSDIAIENYALFNIHGKILVKGSNEIVDMTIFENGTYYLQVILDNGEQQLIKVLKQE